MLVELTWEDVSIAAWIGVRRALRARMRGRETFYGVGSPVFDPDIVGAVGEAAVAKALNYFWLGNGSALDYAGDVGPFHVRATEREGGCLILHDRDDDSAQYYLARLKLEGLAPSVELSGWIYGRDGKRQDYWRTDVRCPAYFVPQAALRPVEETPSAA